MHHETLDRLSLGDTFVHRLDPRVKLIALFLYTFALIATNKYEIAALAPYLVFPAFLVLLGEVPPGFLARGIALGIPFVFMVAIFNPIFDATPVTCRLGSATWTLRGGVVSCANIMIRFLFTASALIAFMATTPFHRVIHGLRLLRFPSMLLMVLSFLYRYLFVLIDVGLRMRRARDCRAVGGATGAGGRTIGLRMRAFAGVVGVLFLRSLDQSERVYAAMLSRGFSGELPTLDRLRMNPKDWLFLAVALCYVAVLFLKGHPYLLSGS
ncbi:MAG: cobalt ECF transporter T component CbiQ [Planctomycetes bacterium]|nr:cobalt ECF transporter T component CbiQ [Planctomycetota bacterium]